MPNGQIAGRDAVTAVTVGPAPPPPAAAAAVAVVTAAIAGRTTSWRPRARPLHGRRVHRTQKHRTHPVAARQTGELTWSVIFFLLPILRTTHTRTHKYARTHTHAHTGTRTISFLSCRLFSVCFVTAAAFEFHPTPRARPVRPSPATRLPPLHPRHPIRPHFVAVT